MIKLIFLECRVVRKLWDQLGIHMNLASLTPQHHWLRNLSNLKVERRNMQWKETFPFYLWNIWLTRNENLCNNKQNLINIQKSLTLAIEFKHRTNSHAKEKPIVSFVKWRMPTRG